MGAPSLSRGFCETESALSEVEGAGNLTAGGSEMGNQSPQPPAKKKREGWGTRFFSVGIAQGCRPAARRSGFALGVFARLPRTYVLG